ncbi:protein argonaute-4-like [Paramacrobiotus metropolitanus]|uniref:protein argonaute-4-like n=1 Tax=Paramacrobiotus metropolitanus TaxID=2943436 RepID=UPI002445E49A|nr:protein argonaute-4-like [Paramacrobiotus metropolitanus]
MADQRRGREGNQRGGYNNRGGRGRGSNYGPPIPSTARNPAPAPSRSARPPGPNVNIPASHPAPRIISSQQGTGPLPNASGGASFWNRGPAPAAATAPSAWSSQSSIRSVAPSSVTSPSAAAPSPAVNMEALNLGEASTSGQATNRSSAVATSSAGTGASTDSLKTDDNLRKPMRRPLSGGFATSKPGSRKIMLKVNHYPLYITDKKGMLHCYALGMSARCGERTVRTPLPAAMKRHIMKEFRRLNPRMVLGQGRGGEIAYNKADEIFAGFLLANVTEGAVESFTFDTTMPDDQRTYTCTVELQKRWSERMSNVIGAFQSGNLGTTPAEDYIRPVDTILRQAMLVDTLLTVEIGRSLYIPEQTFQLRDGRVAISKLFASVRPSAAMHGLAAVLLTSGSAFYKEQPLLQFCKDLGGKLSYGSDFRLPVRFAREISEKELQGLKVEVPTRDSRTRQEYQKTYTIRRIRDEGAAAPALAFNHNGEHFTVADYYTRVLHRRIQFPSLQVVEMTNGAFIPMEYCVVKKNQQLLDRVASLVAEEMVKRFSKAAPLRMQDVQTLRMQLINDTNPVLNSFSLGIGGEMLEVEGHVLRPPTVSQRNRSRPIEDGSWRADGDPVESPVHLDKWTLCYIDCYEVQNFVSDLQQIGGRMGIRINTPQDVSHIPGQEIEGFINWLRPQNVQLVIFIENCKKKASPWHSIIKRCCESGSQTGIKSQFIVRMVAERTPNLANVLRKINVKLGGLNFKFSRPVFLKGVKTMIIGADVTHPKGAGLRKRPSVAAVVANTDEDFVRYKAVLEPQIGERGRLQEIIPNFGAVMKKLFEKYGDIPPQRIIYFRDGISEGQYSQALTTEMIGLVDACQRIYKIVPPITMIIVTKRHQTRLSCADKKDERGAGQNVPAGTVADKGICSDLTFDWYQATHHGIQGTSRPAHYVVMVDESNFTADQLQELAFALAHGYQRATRSVSLPAPVYYAHLAAERAKQILGQEEYPPLASDNPETVSVALQRIRETLKINTDGMYWL